jgi:hypothetical protein
MNPELNVEYYIEDSHEIAFLSDLGYEILFQGYILFSVLCTKCIKLTHDENMVSLFTHFVSETNRRIFINFSPRGIDTVNPLSI